MIRRTLALILALAALGGCARQGANPPLGSAPTPTITTGTGTGSGTGTSGQLPSTVQFSRTGGFAGVNQLIIIKSDGAWTYTTKGGGAAQTGNLDSAQVTALRDLVNTPGFLTEMRQVKSDDNCADGFTYAVTVGSEAASWVDCGGAPRPNLQKAIDLVTQATPF